MLISLKDKAKGTFTAPMLVESVEEAKRSFILCFMNGQQSMVSQFPGQFDLYQVGDFDVNSGIMQPINPVFIMNGMTAKLEAINTIQASQVDTITPTPSDEEVSACL